MKLKLLVHPLKPAKKGLAERSTPLLQELELSFCIIGKKDSQLTLHDPRVSRQHALLYENFKGQLVLRDLGSTNGTMVNKEKKAECTLRAGDEIRIGGTIIILLEYEGALKVSNEGSSASLTDAEEPHPDTVDYVDQKGVTKSHVSIEMLLKPPPPKKSQK